MSMSTHKVHVAEEKYAMHLDVGNNEDGLCDPVHLIGSVNHDDQKDFEFNSFGTNGDKDVPSTERNTWWTQETAAPGQPPPTLEATAQDDEPHADKVRRSSKTSGSIAGKSDCRSSSASQAEDRWAYASSKSGILSAFASGWNRMTVVNKQVIRVNSGLGLGDTYIQPPPGHEDLSFLISEATTMRKRFWYDPRQTCCAPEVLKGAYNDLESEAGLFPGIGCIEYLSEELNCFICQIIMGGALAGVMAITAAFPGKSWIECSALERFWSMMIYSFVNLNWFAIGVHFYSYDIEKMMQDKQYFIYYVFRFNLVWVGVMFFFTEITRLDEDFDKNALVYHRLYVLAAALNFLAFVPLQEQIRKILCNPKPWRPYPPFSKVAIEGWLWLVVGAFGAVSLFLYYAVDQLFLSTGGDDRGARFLRFCRPLFILIMRKFAVRLWCEANNNIAMPYMQFRSLGHIYLDGGIVTALGAALTAYPINVVQFMLIDWVAFALRVLSFTDHWSEHPAFGRALRLYRWMNRAGKIRPFPGQNEALVRGYDLYVGNAMVTAGFVMLLILYPISKLNIGGFAVMSMFIFPKGDESYAYVCILAASAYIQDRVAMSFIRKEVTREARYTRYLGGKFWGKDCRLFLISSVGPSAWLCGVLVWSGYLLKHEGLAAWSN